jgi:CENP-B N-terminal DNA-binding domain
MYLLPIKGKDKKDSAQFDQDFYSANILSENNKPQLKRKAISLEKKIQVLNRLDTGESASAVGEFFDLNEATVQKIKKNQDRIRST